MFENSLGFDFKYSNAREYSHNSMANIRMHIRPEMPTIPPNSDVNVLQDTQIENVISRFKSGKAVDKDDQGLQILT